MATGKVEYVLTGDAGALASALDDSTKRVAKLEDQLGKMQNKQKEAADAGGVSFQNLGRGVLDFAKGVAGGISAVEIFKGVLENLKEQAKALNDELARTAQTSASISGPQGKSISTGAVQSPADLNRIKQTALNLAGESGLGTGGAARVTDALGALTLKTGLSELDRIEILRGGFNVAKRVEGTDLTMLTKAVADIKLNEGVSNTGAQNMLLAMGGKVTDPSAKAALFENLKPFMKESGLGAAQTMGMAGTISGILNDSEGGATQSVFETIFRKLKSDPGKIAAAVSKKTGAPFALSGDLMQNLSQLSDADAGNILGDEPEIFGLSKSAESVNVLRQLMGRGGLGRINAETSRLLGRDIIGTGAKDIGRAQLDIFASDPANAARMRLSGVQSGTEADRGRDVFGSQITSEASALGEKLRASLHSDTYVNYAMQAYRAHRLRGHDPDEARAEAIRSGREASVPVLGPIFRAGLDMANSATAGGVASAASSDHPVVKAIEKQTQAIKSSNRPLPSNVSN